MSLDQNIAILPILAQGSKLRKREIKLSFKAEITCKFTVRQSRRYPQKSTPSTILAFTIKPDHQIHDQSGFFKLL